MNEPLPPASPAEATPPEGGRPDENPAGKHPEGNPAVRYAYRENPARALYIDEPIGEDLYRRLMREYHVLRAESYDPITVYISSPGGTLTYLGWIRDLLFTPDLDGNRPLIVTVAKGMAASAAARLLVYGDFSICYPSSVIHCHGTRFDTVDDLTHERAEQLGKDLQHFNRSTALEFIGCILHNLAFIYDYNRSEIEKIRSLERVEEHVALAKLIESKLGPGGKRVMRDVHEDIENDKLIRAFLGTNARTQEILAALSTGNAHHDFVLLKQIAEFVFLRDTTAYEADPDKAFEEVKKHFYLQREFFFDAFNSLNEEFDLLVVNILGQEDFARWDSLEAGPERQAFLENTRTKLLPFALLAASIAHRLVVGENPLEGPDAYWIGLVQEVAGMNFPCQRQVLETA